MAEHTKHASEKLEVSVVSEFEVHSLAGAEYGGGIEDILPANTLIKVITPEELEILQPLLVKNGVAASVFEEIKAQVLDSQEEYITPQERQIESNCKQTQDDEPQDDGKTSILAKASKMEVLPITCKNTLAHLYKDKFGSGNRGKCIKYRRDWFTPREFEIQSGRASSKHWRRTIRFEGITLEELIKASVLTTHSLSCSCSKCFDEDYAVYPVKLSPPCKKRRSRHSVEEEQISICKKSQHNMLTNSNRPKDPLTHDKEHPARSTKTNQTRVLVSIPAIPVPDMAATLRRLDIISRTLIHLTTKLKECIAVINVMRARQLERSGQVEQVAVKANEIKTETDQVQMKDVVTKTINAGKLISIAYTGA